MGEIAATNDLDLFSPQPIEQSVAESRVEIISANIAFPNSDINTPLEFTIPAVHDLYTDLSPTFLEIQLKVQYADVDGDKNISETKTVDKTAEKTVDKRDATVPEAREIGFIQQALMSMFSGVEVTWNNQLIVGNNFCLPWTSYLDVLSGYKLDSRKSWLTASGWYEGGVGGLTDGCKATFRPFFNGKSGQFMGPIMLDLFQMRKYIVPNIKMMVKLFRRAPETYIMYRVAESLTPKRFKVTLEHAYLHVKRVKLYEPARLAIEQNLAHTPAYYEFTDTVMRPIMVAENIFSVDTVLQEGGVLPIKVDIVQIQQSEYTGPILNNPFNFQHFNVKNVSLEKNGQPINVPYQCDLRNNNYARMYLDYFKNAGCNIDRTGMSQIDYARYANGYTIISFNLSRFDECSTTLATPSEQGQLRLKMDYIVESSPIRPIVILCFLKYNKQLTVDYTRAVKFIQ